MKVFLTFLFFSNLVLAQEPYELRYFDMELVMKISDYHYIDSVLVIDFSTYRSIQQKKFSLKADKRVYVLPKTASKIEIPSKFTLKFQKLTGLRRKYLVTISCPERVQWPNDIISRVYIEKYDVLVVIEDYMIWHICELKSMELCKD